MDRKVVALIDKLQELKREDAATEELSYYVKKLYAELLCKEGQKNKERSTKKISVIMPFYKPDESGIEPSPPVEQTKDKKAVQIEHVKEEPEKLEVREEEKITGQREPGRKPKQVPVYAEAVAVESASQVQTSLWDQSGKTAPSPQSTPSRTELNDLIAEQRTSLNDFLKKEREEVGSRLGNSPIKDLHQAIGLNEKFGFINELFRGDQSLYNRSIKTINECKDLNEALYWINRELEIKLGWQEKDKTVQQFYALIRKRFS